MVNGVPFCCYSWDNIATVACHFICSIQSNAKKSVVVVKRKKLKFQPYLNWTAAIACISITMAPMQNEIHIIIMGAFCGVWIWITDLLFKAFF